MISALVVTLCAGLLLYTFVGYPALVRVLAARRDPAPAIRLDSQPRRRVEVVISALDEAPTIAHRVTGLEGHQTRHLLTVAIVDDGSQDGTAEVARRAAGSRTTVHRHGSNRGRAVVHSEAVARSTADIIVFSDAETRFADGFIDELVAPFADPQVGCVTGNLHWRNEAENATTNANGLYWRYEIALRRAESTLGLLPTATGACMAVRRSLFRPLAPDEDVDCVSPLHVIDAGYRTVFAESAIAYDVTPGSSSGVYRSRARMTSKDIVGTLRALRHLRLPAAVRVSLISRKVLRWMASIFLIVGVAVAGFTDRSTLVGLVSQAGAAAVVIITALGLIATAAGRQGRLAQLTAFQLNLAAMSIGILRAAGGERIAVYRQHD